MNIGDRVVVTGHVLHVHPGMTGTIVSIHRGYVGVEFDAPFSGAHNCNGNAKPDRGGNVYTYAVDEADENGKPIKFTGNAVCVDPPAGFTKGKIYTFLYGKTTNDFGREISTEDILGWFKTRFAKVVEW